MTATRPVSVELRSAVGDVTAAYNRLPRAAQMQVGPATRDGLDSELRVARAAGERERALAAIRAWRGWWLGQFGCPAPTACPSENATKGAP